MDEQSGTDGWLTLVQAADRLGVSIYTVRRQVKRGELEAQQVATRHGFTWLVRLSDLPGELPTVGSEPNHAAQGVDTRELLRMLDQRDQTIMEPAGRVGYLQAELATTREKLLALEEPREDPVVLLDRVTAERNGADANPKPRPWWPFWSLLIAGIATVAGLVVLSGLLIPSV